MTLRNHFPRCFFMPQLSIANIIYSLGLGVSFIIAHVLLYYMAGLGLIVITTALAYLGIGLLIAGVGLIITFIILLIYGMVGG